jgi:hypothetical protein
VAGWIAIAFWTGLLPAGASIAYYSVKRSADVESVLKESRPSDVLWVARTGSASWRKSGAAVLGSSFGINAEDSSSLQRSNKLASGNLSETSQSTYLVLLRGAALPRVLCVFRDATPNGVHYEVEDLGSKPLGAYMVLVILGSLGIRTVITLSQIFRRSGQARTGGTDRRRTGGTGGTA